MEVNFALINIVEDELYNWSQDERLYLLDIIQDLMSDEEMTYWEENNDYELSSERIVFEGIIGYMKEHGMEYCYPLDKVCMKNPDEVKAWIMKKYGIK